MDDLQAMMMLRDYVPEPSKDELDEQWRYIAAETVHAAPRSRRRYGRRLQRIWIPAVAATLTGVVASLTWLGEFETDVRDIEPERAPDLSLVISGDYDPAFSPEELIDKRKTGVPGLDIKVVAVGAVEEIVAGRTISYNDGDLPDRRLVMRVRASDVLLAGDQLADERVYVEMYQGGYDADGSPHFSLEEWNTAIPEGTRVMLFLIDAYHPDADDPTRIDNAGRGVPDDATLMQPDPQGLIVEYDGNVVNQDGDDLNELWGVSSIEEIAERVRQHLG